MGYEVAGIVDWIGEGVDQALLGQAVVAMTRFKGQAEMVTVGANQVFEKPESLNFEQAAAVPVNYLTAYALLVAMGGLRKGESVLIHNAGGGVGWPRSISQSTSARQLTARRVRASTSFSERAASITRLTIEIRIGCPR